MWRTKPVDTPTSFDTDESPLIQPSRASLSPEIALVDCNGRQSHEVIFTQHMPSLRPGTFLSFWQTKTLADKFQIPDDEYEKR